MHLYNDKPIPAYAFEPDDLVGNPLIRINKNDCTVNYKKSDFLVPHRKDYYFFGFVKQGSSRHWVDTVPYDLKPNRFYFTAPHQVQLKEQSEPFTGYIICFTKDFLVSAHGGILKDLPVILNKSNAHELLLSDADVVFVEDILEKLIGEYNTKESWQHPMLQAYVNILLMYISRLYAEQFCELTPVADTVLLKNYLSKIDASYTRLHEVADYAEILNISAGHLSEVVKEQSGKPAIAHIHERLIMEAKRLLFHTDYAVKEIAFHLGFEDASYFSRFFKRITQSTPADFRNSFREMYH